jgi:NIMA (never in mitosis gene a)-related kinase 1/4/5
MSSKSSLKDFEILTKLGQGSFGTVFKVRRKLDKSFYVMKNIDISQMDRRGQQESVNEVKILASLDNPYIVKYFDSFIESKTLHIVMEFCDKGDLSQSIRSQMGRLINENKIWKYFIQMCLGLEFIHSKKILHRDIKSMNVFLVRDDWLRIGDLGVAKVLANTAAFAHTMVGTPYYLSPELCEEKPYNVKSDVWALGCVLYELCTLKHPFDALNQAALLLKIIKGTYCPVSENYSKELREVLDLCLCKDYRKRPNIPSILNRPMLKDRAIGLNIHIPSTSVLSEVPVAIPKEPALIYQSQMSVIEEEKAPRLKPKAHDHKSASPAPSKPQVKPAEKDLKSNPVKVPEKEIKNRYLIQAEPPKAKDQKEIVEKKPQKEVIDKKNPVAKELKPNDPKKLQTPQIKEKESNEIKNKIKPAAEFSPHFNLVQFEPPSKPSELKIKQSPVIVSPIHVAQKIENKPDPKNPQNKLAVKPTPKIENKQKIIKPGAQGPYFMPPSRPQDLKNLKKDPEPPKILDEIRQVQDLPDYPKNKKVTIDIFKPVLLKSETKTYKLLEKPIFEDYPFIIEEFGETIDWNFTKTGFTRTSDWTQGPASSEKDFIPVSVPVREDLQTFQINRAENAGLEEDIINSDDEFYYVSESDSDIDSSGSHEFHEGDTDTTENTGLQKKIEKLEKELKESIRLIEVRREEIIRRVGEDSFNQMHEFFKEKPGVKFT